jgi:hypothetical protein
MMVVYGSGIGWSSGIIGAIVVDIDVVDVVVIGGGIMVVETGGGVIVVIIISVIELVVRSIGCVGIGISIRFGLSVCMEFKEEKKRRVINIFDNFIYFF